MTSAEVISDGKLLTIEITGTWDFMRNIHSYQAHVVDKGAMQRYVIGKYDSCDIAERKAREWINNQ